MKVLTFNIHKGLSPFSRRRTLQEIRRLLEKSEADIVALQEVGSRFLPRSIEEQFETQLEYLADSVWSHSAYVQNATYPEGHHGNAILSRYPIIQTESLNLSLHSLEQRGLLCAKLETDKGFLYVLCTHLNLFERHREIQMQKIQSFIQNHLPAELPKILLGDFNDWRGRLHPKCGFRNVVEKLDAEVLRSFPSFFPLFSLDRIYCQGLEAKRAEVFRDPRLAFVSDHLPVLAELAIADRSLR